MLILCWIRTNQYSSCTEYSPRPVQKVYRKDNFNYSHFKKDRLWHTNKLLLGANVLFGANSSQHNSKMVCTFSRIWGFPLMWQGVPIHTHWESGRLKQRTAMRLREYCPYYSVPHAEQIYLRIKPDASLIQAKILLTFLSKTPTGLQ